MAKKSTEPKIILEREYTVPLRKQWLKVPEYKRVPKAVKALKQFIARHMKLYDSDLRKVKIDITLNNEMRFRGIKKPPAKIKVKAVKLDSGIIRVELAKLPDKLKFTKTKEEKKQKKLKTKLEEIKAQKEPAPEQEKPEQSEETKEKQESAKEANSREDASKKPLGVLDAEQQAKQAKHTTKVKEVITPRKALGR